MQLTTDGPTTGTGETSSDDGNTTMTNPVCPPPQPFSQIVTAEDATVVAPAVLGPSWGGLSGAPMVAYSLVEGSGLIEFEVDVPCDGTYHVWAVLWDRYFGSGYSCGDTPNADSVYVYADAGAEQRWNWGCNTCMSPDETWEWGRVEQYVGNPCTTTAISYTWTAGAHTVTFRNESAGTLSDPPDVAAIAAIAISDDETFDPSTLYTP